MRSPDLIGQWPVDHAAVAVVSPDGVVRGRAGDQQREFGLASVTKPLTAYAVLLACEEGGLDLDQPAGPPGSTVRHLLAHASGLAFRDAKPLAAPGSRRLYSNSGFDQLAALVAESAGMSFAAYLTEGVLSPLGMSATRLDGSAAADAASSVADLARFAAELQRPRLLHPSTVAAATEVVAFPGLSGVLPGFGHQKTNDWGLGFEIRDHKTPHWTGTNSSPATFGHFGQSGTFLWVDPGADVACVCLTDRAFGPWAAQAWPAFTDAVLAELAGTRDGRTS